MKTASLVALVQGKRYYFSSFEALWQFYSAQIQHAKRTIAKV